MSETNIYEIWSEGYVATGNSSGANYFGSQEARTFKEAIELFFEERKDKHYVNSSKTAYWGCRFFDNESEARQTFG